VKVTSAVSTGTERTRAVFKRCYTQQCAQVNTIKELQREVVEFNKIYSLVSNLLPVYNMLKDLEVSMLKIIAHAVSD
jgi:hypothetical protein